MKIWRAIRYVVKVGVLIAVVAGFVSFFLWVHRDMVAEAAFMAKVKASQTVMPREYIVTPHRTVRIREMPLGVKGWTSSSAIALGRGDRCFLVLDKIAELNVKPDQPAVEVRRLKDGSYEATVLDESLTWEPSNVTGSERVSGSVYCYFPLHVGFPDIQKADAR